MEKSIYSRDYAILINLLRERRREVKITQVELAKRLNQTQSFISKCERLERRLDVIELRAWCESLGMELAEFIALFDGRLSN
ncbi:MAG: helix-turn-helix transcriptional regulator [Armatimonadetes bacterium]|nr:helix-turn-helix transcriptional regulator [Armatimonadota bacterium]